MQTVAHAEYRVSARVLLQAGDVFRANGGPYYVLRDETGKKVKSSMAAKGPFRFQRYCASGRKKWIEAISIKEGGFVVLKLTKWRTLDLPNFINRPYKILGKKRPPKKR
jgi:hypothetical protein